MHKLTRLFSPSSNQVFKLCKDNFSIESKPSYSAIGDQKIIHPVSVFSEFGKVKALVLGYAGDNEAQIQDTNQAKNSAYSNQKNEVLRQVQNEVAQKLTDHGIHVVRAREFDYSEIEKTARASTQNLYNFNSRDHFFYYHDSVYECFPTLISGQTENKDQDWIFCKQREMGAKWYKSQKTDDNNYRPSLNASNILKVGLDFFYFITCP